MYIQVYIYMHVIHKSNFTLYSEQLLWQDLHVASITIYALHAIIRVDVYIMYI